MSDGRTIALLPPLMGLPNEAHHDGGFATAFYTCLLNARRMFVFTDYGKRKWCVQVAYESDRAGMGMEEFFFDAKDWLMEIPRDPITLQALLHHLAFAEPDNAHSKEPTATVGTDDSLLALHVPEGGIESVLKR